MLKFTLESPLGPDLLLLMQRHEQAMHADTPLESIHMLDPAALAMPGIRFFVLRDSGRAIGMGAFKALDATHAEIKSMHVLAEERGRGLAQMMLDHLMAEALAAGFTKLSLETGPQPSFAPARMLYLKAGFAECPPFPPYVADPYSTFMSRTLLGFPTPQT